MARKGSKRQSTGSLGERMEDFGEEVGRIGEQFGERMERKGNEIGDELRSAFGFVWPIIGSIVGLICFAIAIWALNYIGANSGFEFLTKIAAFFLSNLGLFFILFLFFSYMDFFSKTKRRAFRPFSPIVTAAGIAVAVWVIANAAIIAAPSLGIGFIAGIAAYTLEKILWFFIFFALVGYLVFLLSRGSEEATVREVSQMKKAFAKKETEGVKHLYRSGKEKILGGVCGGVAEYLKVDPVIIRLLWVAGVLAWGFGVLLYIIMWIIVPRNPAHAWG